MVDVTPRKCQTLVSRGDFYQHLGLQGMARHEEFHKPFQLLNFVRQTEPILNMWVMGTSGASPTPRSPSSGHRDHAPDGRSVGLWWLTPGPDPRAAPSAVWASPACEIMPCPGEGRRNSWHSTHCLTQSYKRLASPGRETNPAAQLWSSGSPMGPGFSQTRAHPFLAFLLCQTSCCPNFLSPESIPSTNLLHENLGWGSASQKADHRQCN